jgi:hypothetical protein
MKKMFTALSLIIAMTLSGAANANFVYTDWKASGDSKSLLHEETGLEWLRLSSTRGQSINSVTAALDTTYDGWRLPTNDEITEVMQGFWARYGGTNLQYTTRTNRSNGDARAAVDFARKFGQGDTSAAHHYALYKDEDNIVRLFGNYVNGSNGSYANVYALEHAGTYNESTVLGGYGGVFLVSDGGTTLSSQLDPSLNMNNQSAPINDVPAPFIGAMLSGLALLGFSRRKAEKSS